jgi:hypothetical protein
MKPHERIIRSRGERPSVDRRELPPGDNEPYEAYTVTEGFPQMGFSVFCRSGNEERRRHGFLFHNLDNLDLIERGDDEYLTFTHRGKAVTMRGRDLHGLFEAILAHTLQAIYEFDDAIYAPLMAHEQIIDRIAVTALPGSTPGAMQDDAPAPSPQRGA